MFCISVTSRPKGEYETDGENFWFLTEEELVASLDRDEFMEVRQNVFFFKVVEVTAKLFFVRSRR